MESVKFILIFRVNCKLKFELFRYLKKSYLNEENIFTANLYANIWFLVV